ncbi:MAG: hypothetical protein JWR24_3934 [Actinoallomurus sp.]|nr:hypothetical protein [Actinoallomurus sp.]
MGIPKRLALVISGAAFAGGAALMLGAASHASASVAPASAPATGTPQSLAGQFFWGGGCGGCGCCGCCDNNFFFDDDDDD